MKENLNVNYIEEIVISDLIRFYSKFIEMGLTPDILDIAKTIYNKYTIAMPFLSDFVQDCIWNVLLIAYDIDTETIDFSDAKNVLDRLNNLKI